MNIPFEEISRRVCELPSKRETVLVLGPIDLANRTVELLTGLGRAAAVAEQVQNGEHVRGRLWRPNAFLESILSELPPGIALDIGCGAGRDAVYMAARGWRVVAVDRLPDAIEMAHALAKRYLQEPGMIAFKVERDIARVSGRFDLVSCLFHLDRSVFGHKERLLKPGGSFVAEAFTDTHRLRYGRPKHDSDLVRSGELASLAASMKVLRYDEGWHDRKHTARLFAALDGSG